jgi:hypothetical protein
MENKHFEVEHGTPLCEFSSAVFVVFWISEFHDPAIRNFVRLLAIWSPAFDPFRFEVDAATIVPSFLGWFCARVLPLFLTVIFMVPFRLVIAPEIACFIGFFGNWPRF